VRAAEKPNIIVVLADDLGWGSLGCYGAKDLETPNLDRLAREGRRFTHAYAAGSVCSPTRYGLLTGRYYWRTHIKDGKVLPANAPLIIETNRLTLASLCQSQGYRTAGFGKWHLGWTAERVRDWSVRLAPGPLQVGFDYYFGMAANLGSGPHSFIENEEVTGRIPGEPILVRGGSRDADTTSGIREAWKPEQVMETLTRRVTGWIETNRAGPFFVYFAPNAIHEPIRPHPRFSGSRYGKYGDFIRELDWSVGEILATLDRLKLAENTLILFSSDNGGVVNPNNPNASTAMQAGLKINGELRGGKHSEWEGGFREPFLVRWPGKVPANTVSDQVICLNDLVATFASLLGVALPKRQAEDSFDVLRAFTEAKPGPPVRDHVILQAANATYAIRMGDWKLVERSGAPEFESARNPRKAAAAEKKRRAVADKPDELYNLKTDPSETRNVRAEHAELAAKMKKLLNEARERGFTRSGAGG
ncbi:MAG: sulfatase-like hydrolase/transferase, partial [Verrucomicrobiales bacterium]|nr:sulfatase-like hydrolase/transferase [Verrucomicrobiales bacterium]